MDPFHPHKILFEEKFIEEEQYNKLDLLESKRLVSVFYELRTLLYLGVLLLSTGVGILVYKNIGSVGHIIALVLIVLLTCYCFFYSFKHQASYSREKLQAPNPYFDYVLLLGCLLFISVLGYLEFLFGIVGENLRFVTLFTSVFFFFISYRLDHLAVLSLAITAFISFLGISVSPQQWYGGSTNFEPQHYYITGLILSSVMGGLAIIFNRIGQKKHFTFTYINFSSVIFLCAAIVGMLVSKYSWIYILLAIIGVLALVYYAIREQTFLFLLYAYIAGFVVLTYLFAQIMPKGGEVLWLYYFVFSCGAFIFFLIKYKSLFRRKE